MTLSSQAIINECCRDRRLFKCIFKNPCGDSELEIALQVQCFPLTVPATGSARARVKQTRHGVRKESLVLPCRPCETAEHRVISNRQHRPVGDVLTVLFQDNIVLYGSARHDTSHQISRTLSTAPPPFPPPFLRILCHRGVLQLLSQADVALNAIPNRKVKRKEVSVWREMQVLEASTIPTSYAPFLFHHSPPSLPPLPLPHDACTYACHLLSPNVFLLLRSDFTSGRVADKVLSRLRARRRAIGGELFKRMHEVARPLPGARCLVVPRYVRSFFGL